ncbi:MAG: ROK family transcriptional regulator [Spirochaetia bacterium]|nr:ROK family transcriptional regulator [Spirochaetia bacterium]MCF7946747.1 ROK family transcriptional regulator [Spirochaetia bacterium]MCF7952459.1 ROK family transcriptional regulator [Spirochaetales bacterium]
MKRTKIINRSRIMREIWIHRETSRIDIARSLELDKSTISNNVNELLQLGIILETREGSSSPLGGRKPVHLKLNKHYGIVLGLELRPDSYTAVAVDLEGEIVFSKYEKSHINGLNFKEKFMDIVCKLRKEINPMQMKLLGIGIGVSGVVNMKEGIIKYSIPMEIKSAYNFYQQIDGEIDVPVFIDNDANASVWGEIAFHRRKELKDFIYLLLEIREQEELTNIDCNTIGVGLGLVLNGNVHYGHNYSAGEFRSLFRHNNSTGQFSLTVDEQRQVLYDKEMWRSFLHELGAHISLIVNTFNLTHIILGGQFGRYDQEVAEIFEEEIKKNWPYPYAYEVKKNIWLSSFGDQAVAYGAAGMVLNKLFSDLEILEEYTGHIDLQSEAGLIT